MLKITLKLKEEPVEVTHKDGTVKEYMIKELIGVDRDGYMTGMSNRMKFNAKGEPQGLKTFDGVQSSLLCKTLYNDENKLVNTRALDDFPASALNALFEASQKLSALDLKGDGEDEAKND